LGILEIFEPLYRFLPEVAAPAKKNLIQKRLIWTSLVLVIYFILGNIQVIGLTEAAAGRLAQFETLLASNLGTLTTVGIGPIVLASIILQLLVGGKLINIDLSNPEQRKKFASMQKLFAIFLCFFESLAYTGFGVFPSLIQPAPGMLIPVVLQVALGAIILLYLDEVVSKHGIGSGISLFIAAGVAGTFFWQLFQPVFFGTALLNPEFVLNLQGRFFLMLSSFIEGNLSIALPILVAIIFSIIIFFTVVFAEGMHINIPITTGRHGMGGRFPVKFLYVSNMPVILAAALFANIQIWSSLAQGIPYLSTFLNGLSWVTSVPRVGAQQEFSLIEGLIISFFNPQGLSLGLVAFEVVHAVIYIILLTILCVVFGRFWVEMGNQGPEAVAKQLINSGMSIPGFRNDPRIIRSILDRYIPPISILGGAFVGILAGVADITTGSLVSGTGILLTVGIVYRFYEELAKEAVFESNMLLKKIMG